MGIFMSYALPMSQQLSKGDEMSSVDVEEPFDMEDKVLVCRGCHQIYTNPSYICCDPFDYIEREV